MAFWQSLQKLLISSKNLKRGELSVKVLLGIHPVLRKRVKVFKSNQLDVLFSFVGVGIFSSVFIIHIWGIENARVFCCWKGIDRISPSKVAQKHCKINLITNHSAFLLLLIWCFLQRNFEFCNTTFLSSPQENLNCVFLGSWFPPFFDSVLHYDPIELK